MVFTTAVDEVADRSLTVVFKVAAPRLGPATQAVARAAKQGDWEVLADGTAQVGGVVLSPSEFDLRLVPREDATSRTLPGNNGVVILDVEPGSRARGRGLGP